MIRLILLITISLLPTICSAVTVQLEKRGAGSGKLTSEIGDCGSATPICTYELNPGDSISWLYERDDTGAQLMGWGGACTPAEDNTTCTITITDALLRRYPTTVPVFAGLGYAQDGACRASGGIWDFMYFPDLQTAYNALQAAVVSNPIECKTGTWALNPVAINVTLNAGFASFTPPEMSAEPTTINNLIITTGTMTIAQGSLAVACGWTEVVGPYTLGAGQTLTIGVNPCMYGFIIR